MLYNHDLIKKLRIGAFAVSAFMGGYAILTYLDHNIPALRLILVFICIIVSVIATYLLKKPAKREFIAYAVSMLLMVILMMFRVVDNIALDISLFGLIVGLTISFGLQLKKSSGFA